MRTSDASSGTSGRTIDSNVVVSNVTVSPSRCGQNRIKRGPTRRRGGLESFPQPVCGGVPMRVTARLLAGLVVLSAALPALPALAGSGRPYFVRTYPNLRSSDSVGDRD